MISRLRDVKKAPYIASLFNWVICKSIFRLKSKIWILVDKKLLNIKWGAAFDLPSAKYVTVECRLI